LQEQVFPQQAVCTYVYLVPCVFRYGSQVWNPLGLPSNTTYNAFPFLTVYGGAVTIGKIDSYIMLRQFEMFGCHNVIVAKISGATSTVAMTFGRRTNKIIAPDSYSRMVTPFS